MSPKPPAPPSAVELHHIKPPPEPWGRLATIGSIYLLGDVEQLGAERVLAYLHDHPLIAVKTGRKEHTVIGQYRSWELLLTFSHLKPSLFRTVPVYLKSAPSDGIAAMAAENLFMEGLVSTLSPEYAITQLANLWRQLPESSRQKLLPIVQTQADFANVLAYDSRTGFDPRRLNRLNRPSTEKSPAQPAEPSVDSEKNSEAPDEPA